jgi:hypothetical protein
MLPPENARAMGINAVNRESSPTRGVGILVYQGNGGGRQRTR